MSRLKSGLKIKHSPRGMVKIPTSFKHQRPGLGTHRTMDVKHFSSKPKSDVRKAFAPKGQHLGKRTRKVI